MSRARLSPTVDSGWKQQTARDWLRRFTTGLFIMVVAGTSYMLITPPPMAELPLTDHFRGASAP